MDSGVITYGFALFVCIYGGLHAARNIARGRASERWPIVEGEVLQAFVKNRFGRHVPVVHYRYRSQDGQFQRARIVYANFSIASKVGADSFIRGFRKGAAVPVRVRPGHPGESVLLPGNRFVNWVELIAALLFGLYVAFRLFSPGVD
jgi:hypothetical protein